MFRTRHYSQQQVNSPQQQSERNACEACPNRAYDFLWEFGGALDTERRHAQREAASAAIYSLDKALAFAG